MMTDQNFEKCVVRNSIHQSTGGFALVTVLLLVSLLAVIGLTLNRTGGMQATIANNLNHGEEAYYIANAGLQHAVFKLAGTPTMTGPIFTDVPFGDGTYTVSITSDVTPMGKVLISSTGKLGTVERTIEKRHFPTTIVYPVLVGDTFVDKENRTNNYGISTYTKLGIQESDKQKRIVLAFDLSSLPPGIFIKSAMLHLYMYDRERSTITNNFINVQIHRITSSWIEGVQDGTACTVGSTWQQQDCNTTWAGGNYDMVVETNATLYYDEINKWHQWNIKNLVQYWYDNPSSNYGMLIKDSSEQANSESFVAYYTSGENPDVNLRPKLIVRYIEP